MSSFKLHAEMDGRIPKKNIVWAGIITVVMAAFLVCFGPLDACIHGYYSSSTAPENIDEEDFSGKVFLSAPFEGSFVPQKKHFVGLELDIADIPENPSGSLTVSVKNSSGKILATDEVEVGRLQDRKWYYLSFDYSFKPGRTYYYSIEAEGDMKCSSLETVDSRYLGTESSDGSNVLIGYAYADSTFTVQEKIMIGILIISVWLGVMILLLWKEKVRTGKMIVMWSFMFVALTWMYMYNSFNAPNSTFGDRKGSDSLVLDGIRAQNAGVTVSQYGLGSFTGFSGEGGSSYANDDNWLNGYSKTEPKIRMASNDIVINAAVPGNYLMLGTGDSFLITDVENDETNVTVTLKYTRPFNFYKYGSLDNARFIDPQGNVLPYATYSAYVNQFGLQGIIYRHLARRLSEETLIFITCSASAAVFMMITILLRKKYNGLLAGCFFVSCWLSPWVVNASRTLYWVQFTWFLPMLAGLWCSMHVKKRKVRIVSYILVWFFIMIKSLCGYEYITAVMLGAVAFLFTDLLCGIFVTKDRKGALLLLRTMVIMGIAALAGFACAICIHARLRGEGDIFAGIKNIIQSDLVRRTWGASMNDFDSVYWDSFNASGWEVFSMYFHTDTPVIAGIDGNLFPLICVIPLIMEAHDAAKKKLQLQEVFLYIIGFLIAVSWFVLAKEHSYIHKFLNFVLWYMLYVPMCFYIIVRHIKDYIKGRNNK